MFFSFTSGILRDLSSWMLNIPSDIRQGLEKIKNFPIEEFLEKRIGALINKLDEIIIFAVKVMHNADKRIIDWINSYSKEISK